MNNSNFNIEKYLHNGTKSARDYILLIRNNMTTVILISIFIIIIAVLYTIFAKDIYNSSVRIKIAQHNQNVLDNSNGYVNAENLDRFIANEIGIIEDYSTRKKVAVALVDSFDNTGNKDLFYLIKAENDEGTNGHKSVDAITGILKTVVKVEQNPGTDVIEISAQSHSPYEAALIANVSALEYQKIDLAMSRDKLTNIRKFLEAQNKEKLDELKSSEDTLMKFQEKGGIVSLDIQSTGLIDQLSQLDAQKEATKIELATSNEVLKQYKFFLKKQNPQLVDYLENQTSQAYINALQQQLADLQVNRDLVLSIKGSNVDVSAKVKDYDQRINDLKQKLSATINNIKAEAFSGNPEQARDLAQKLIEEEIRNSTLSVRLQQLETITNKYEADLKRIPKKSTELSQYQRKRESLQQMYSTVNQKYQEAIINELSQSGNAFIISMGRIPGAPAGPNRLLIIFFGVLIGPLVSFGYIFIKDSFDDTVKTPEDIEKNDIGFLSWIPQFKNNGNGIADNQELSTVYESDSPISESFRAIKARIMHTKADSEHPPKIILVTSSAESEGKTFVSVNLAGSFARSNKRTILLDCDIRRPKIYKIMGVDKQPGLVDYLYQKVKLEDIVRKTKLNNLSFITSGSIPLNPAELLESGEMKNFLHLVKGFYDVIIIDSAPIVAVIDAEILAKESDGTILVVAADKTENRLMMDAVNIIKRNKAEFLGTVLNNFKYKSGYGYYYKYYYHYSNSSHQKRRKYNKIKT